ncbi:U32 family peptidase [Egbenema bharatensis]|uniref:U32 family peptidase n=1 Tax=Egbenema bharatensis TaxID=3463334 RepID=UPI003A89B6FA
MSTPSPSIVPSPVSLRWSTTDRRSSPELLAPAGNWECAKAAVENGADAIYFGLERFNARMRAQNFTEADLPQLMEFLHRRGVKGYITLNTLVFPGELPEAEQYLRTMITAGVDAVIVQDIGICRLIRHLSPDFPIHASTQMTITSAVGVEFAQSLGCQLVVLARECALKEINKIQQQMVDRQIALPLEVFVHGALCVAYSGQCLTSEALGGRSANRGECAQACRMPYELIADGERVELGDRSYLLSPQDLSGLAVLPDLIRAGVHCLKIEGRLKSPEYVANVTRVYRQAIDRACHLTPAHPSSPTPPPSALRTTTHAPANSPQSSDRYNLEMAFSRGLYTGWFRGINNQELVHARFGKKRGVYLGEVKRVQKEHITIHLQAPVKPGDGVVFDNGHPEAKEEGGRIFAVDTHGAEAVLSFGRGSLNLKRIHPGDKVWKTSDPELGRQLRQSYAGDTPHFQQSIDLEVYGELDQPLMVIARDPQGHVVQVESAMPLVVAHSQPLTVDRLSDQLSRLGNTPFRLGTLSAQLNGSLMLPISELNRLRREVVSQLEAQRIQPKRWQLYPDRTLSDLLPTSSAAPSSPAQLIVLVRTLPQIQAALQAGMPTLYCELEDPRQYQEAVRVVRTYRQGSSVREPAASLSSTLPPPELFVAPPRITKPNENWILQQVRSADADGYLIRNYDQLEYFRNDRCIGDFSLNVANPLTASYFKQEFNLERLTVSYDLNIDQLQDFMKTCPAHWFEVTIHQHMPMFHMEHCVFCAFLSEGTDFTNCGRPCETHEVKLRDRTGTEHILQADAGCRNTVFNGVAQTGAEYVHRLMELGVNQFRIEFVNETPEQVTQIIRRYQQLLRFEIKGSQLWRALKLQNQLGVTRGAMVD